VTRNDAGILRLDQHWNGKALVKVAERQDNVVWTGTVAANGVAWRALLRGNRLTARQELVVRHGGRNAQSNNTSKNGCDAIPCIVHDLCLQWSAWNCGSCGQSGYALIN
jgi:hypothetical protein